MTEKKKWKKIWGMYRHVTELLVLGDSLIFFGTPLSLSVQYFVYEASSILHIQHDMYYSQDTCTCHGHLCFPSVLCQHVQNVMTCSSGSVQHSTIRRSLTVTVFREYYILECMAHEEPHPIQLCLMSFDCCKWEAVIGNCVVHGTLTGNMSIQH